MKKRKWSKREVKLIRLFKIFSERNCKISLDFDKNYYYDHWYNDPKRPDRLRRSRYISNRYDEFEFKTLRDFKRFLRKFNDFVWIKGKCYCGDKRYDIISLMRVNDTETISMYLLNDNKYIEEFIKAVIEGNKSI